MTTTTIVFLLIGSCALLLTVASFIFGEFHDLSAHFGASAEHELGFGRVVNSGALVGLVGGFGFVGAFVSSQGVEIVPSSLWGVAGGLVLGLLFGFVYATLRKETATSSYSANELLGLEGVVTHGAVAGSPGEVSLSVKGMQGWRTAFAPEGDLKSGEVVRVTGVVGSAVYVTPKEKR